MGARGGLARFRQVVRGFVYGTAFHLVASQKAVRRREVLERLFILIATGEMLGLPLVPSACSLRFLPFLVPQIVTWKRSTVWRDLEGADLRHMPH